MVCQSSNDSPVDFAVEYDRLVFQLPHGLHANNNLACLRAWGPRGHYWTSIHQNVDVAECAENALDEILEPQRNCAVLPIRDAKGVFHYPSLVT